MENEICTNNHLSHFFTSENKNTTSSWKNLQIDIENNTPLLIHLFGDSVQENFDVDFQDNETLYI